MHENGLDGELDDELGYIKYDYHNKEGENSRSGYSKKTIKTSFGAEQRLKRREAGMVNLNRSLLRRIKHFQNSLNKTGRG